MLLAPKNRRFMKSLMIFCLVLQVNHAKAASKPIDVVFLTQSASRVLKSWSAADLQRFAGNKRNDLSAQKFLFEDSTNSLELNDLASIDLVTITTDTKIIRVPRFLIWRGFFQLKWDNKNEILSTRLKGAALKSLEAGRIITPASYFEVDQIRKIELSDHLTIYPQTKLRLRTNPAASRGEKLFTQSCLACHSVPTYAAPSLNPSALPIDKIKNFSLVHKKWPEMKLDARSERGLIEYSEALALEKVKK